MNPPLPTAIRRARRTRRGAILIYTCIVFPVLLLACAFAVDVGLVMMVKAQLQSAADSAAMAGAGKALDIRGDFYTKNGPNAKIDDTDLRTSASAEAIKFAAKHAAGGVGVGVAVSDIEYHYLNPATGVLETPGELGFNTVRVRTRRDATLNTPLNLFFARFFGAPTASLTAVGQATFQDRVQYLGPAPGNGKSSLMPFAISKDDWDKVLLAQKTGNPIDLDGDKKADIADQLTYDDSEETVTDGKDGIPEIRMFPGNKNLPSGNFGTVEIGTKNSGTPTLERQITDGPTAADFDYHGGEFDFGKPFELSGNPGISAGMKDDISSIIGQERTILLYSKVSGNGANSIYTIVGFAGVRVMKEQLTGNPKGIVIQPAPVRDEGARPGNAQSGYSVYAPTYLSY